MHELDERFKDPGSGNWLLQALFYETAKPEHTDKILFSLKPYDYEGYPSFLRLYLELEDVTEYRVATELLGGIPHWERLCRAPFFKEHLELFRRSLMLKMKSDSLRLLQADAKSASKSSASSSKYLLSQGYDSVSPDKRKAGRPTKEQILKVANDEASFYVDINDDYERIKLNG